MSLTQNMFNPYFVVQFYVIRVTFVNLIFIQVGQGRMSAERGGGECGAVQTEAGRGSVPGQVTPFCVLFGLVWSTPDLGRSDYLVL